MYLEIEASKMTSEQKLYHSLLFILWTSDLADPAAGSHSLSFCLPWLWLVPLLPLEWITPTRASLVNPGVVAGTA